MIRDDDAWFILHRRPRIFVSRERRKNWWRKGLEIQRVYLENRLPNTLHRNKGRKIYGNIWVLQRSCKKIQCNISKGMLIFKRRAKFRCKKKLLERSDDIKCNLAKISSARKTSRVGKLI